MTIRILHENVCVCVCVCETLGYTNAYNDKHACVCIMMCSISLLIKEGQPSTSIKTVSLMPSSSALHVTLSDFKFPGDETTNDDLITLSVILIKVTLAVPP